MILLVTCFSHAAVLSRVVGAVGEHVVTSREVALNQIVERALYPQKGAKKEIPDEPTVAEINQVLLEWMIYFEAKSFSVAPLEDTDLKSAERSVLASATSGEAGRLWSRLSPTTKEIGELLDRKVRAKRFVQFKANASRVPVTDAEALRYFQKNRSRFGDAPFSQFRDQIKAVLVQQQADERIRDWFGVLQKKYKVQKVATPPPAKP